MRGKIRLCSSSITRAEILKERGIAFQQDSADFDEETIDQDDPVAFVYQATMGKSESARKMYGLSMPILTADTVVSAQGKILRKPQDKEDARQILEAQSGQQVGIITCMVLAQNDLTWMDVSATYYQFAPFDPPSLDAYLKSEEWQGKAGGCMVEGFCRDYIKDVCGYESCARGLSVEKLIPWIKEIR